MPQHDELLQQFIQSNSSPEGAWHKEVPVGLAEGIMDTKKIDSVCVVGDSFNFSRSLPKMAQDFKDGTYERKDYFSDRDVVLLEVKTRADALMKGIGQLFIYESLFMEDWDVHSCQKMLLAKESDRFIEQACENIDVTLSSLY